MYASVIVELTGGESVCTGTGMAGATLTVDDEFAAVDGAADS
jgi:hypothetical protein